MEQFEVEATKYISKSMQHIIYVSVDKDYSKEQQQVVDEILIRLTFEVT